MYMNVYFVFSVIQYRYDKAVYSFGETDEITQVCVRIVSGVFIDGGYLTLVFNTLQMTASGKHSKG